MSQPKTMEDVTKGRVVGIEEAIAKQFNLAPKQSPNYIGKTIWFDTPVLEKNGWIFCPAKHIDTTHSSVSPDENCVLLIMHEKAFKARKDPSNKARAVILDANFLGLLAYDQHDAYKLKYRMNDPLVEALKQILASNLMDEHNKEYQRRLASALEAAVEFIKLPPEVAKNVVAASPFSQMEVEDLNPERALDHGLEKEAKIN